MTKNQSIMQVLMAKLMILICALSILVTPIQTTYAASFEDAFRYFGETLTDWSTLSTIANAVSAADLPDGYKTIKCQYTHDGQSSIYEVKVTNAHVSIAGELVDAFVTESLWNSFKTQVTSKDGEAGGAGGAGAQSPAIPGQDQAAGGHFSLVLVDYTSKKVSANKANGCSSAVYSKLKSAFNEASGGSAANDFVFDVLGDNIKPESNEITDAALGKAYALSNMIIYIGISLLSIYFALTVVADLAFLMAPAFRQYLIKADTTEGANWLDPDKSKKVKMLVGGLVSETALLSLGCKKQDGKIGLSDARSIGVDFLVPDWKYFIINKAGMWIVITIFLIIFWSGQLGQLASLVLEFMTWVYNAVLNMLRS